MSTDPTGDQEQSWTQPYDDTHVFFQSWSLWQKMCFILAIAVALVILTGVLKLQWRARLLRKYASKDEEKAIQSNALDTQAEHTETRSEVDIPFGIRALESGMEIDGIWVSRNKNTPIPEELREVRAEGRVSAGSINSKDDSIKSKTSELSLKTSPAESQGSSSSSRHSRSPGDGVGLHNEALPPHGFKSSGNPVSPALLKGSTETAQKRYSKITLKNDTSQYKPKRSSQLRFSTYGEGGTQYHAETLSRLEGKPYKKIPLTLASFGPDSSSDEDGDDNERSSGSSESEEGLSRKPFTTGTPSSAKVDDVICNGVPLKMETEHFELKGGSFKTETDVSEIKDQGRLSHSCQASTHTQSSFQTITMKHVGEKVRVPVEVPNQEAHNRFTTSEITPVQTNACPMTSTEPNTKLSDETELTRWPLLSDPTLDPLVPSSIRTGQVRANKTLRRVNSGFEVLPAGTFCQPASYVTNASSGTFNGALSEPMDVRRNDKRSQKNDTKSKTSALLGWFSRGRVV